MLRELGERVNQNRSMIKGSLEANLSTMWADEEAWVGGIREKNRRKKIGREKETEETRSRYDL